MPQLGITRRRGDARRLAQAARRLVEADEAICDDLDRQDRLRAPGARPRGGSSSCWSRSGRPSTSARRSRRSRSRGRHATAGVPSVELGRPRAASRSSGRRAAAARQDGARARHSPVVARLAARARRGRSIRWRAPGATGGCARRTCSRRLAAEPPPAAEAALYVPPPAGPLSRMRRSIGEHMKRSLDDGRDRDLLDRGGLRRGRGGRRALGVTALPVVAAGDDRDARASSAS